jgi:hypothetical protein
MRMSEPLLWNTLDEAAAWLASKTKEEWTANRILSFSLRHYRAGPDREHPRATYLKAVLPRSTKLGLYKDKTSVDAGIHGFLSAGEMVRFGSTRRPLIAPLYPRHVSDLLVHGETEIGQVASVGDESNSTFHIFVEPLGEKVRVTIDTVRIDHEDIQMLLGWYKHVKKQLLQPATEGQRTPEPMEQAPKPSAANGKKRKLDNILDNVIRMAIDKAGSTNNAAVFLELKELALVEIIPFTGEVIGAGLEYTNFQNKKVVFSKNALAKRLRRLRDADGQ